MPVRTLLWTALLGSACAWTEARSPGLVATDPAPGAVGDARELVAYAWNGGPQVPYSGDDAPLALPFGELGRTPATLLYLPGNGALEEELAANPGVSVGLAEGCTRTVGRMRGALRLAAGGRLELDLAPRELREWTLELWLRPEAHARATWLTLPGLLELGLQQDGALVADLLGEPAVKLKSGQALRLGEWNHVAVVFDGRDTRLFRLFLNGQTSYRGLPAERGLPALTRLELGSAAQSLPSGPCPALEIDELRLGARATSTAELLARAAPNARGAQELTLLFADGEQRLERWPEPCTVPVLDGAELAWGELEHVSSAGGMLRWSPAHWQRLQAPDPPAARTTHPTLALGDGRLFVYGGETRDTHFGRMWNTDDTWILDLRTRRWTRVATELAPSPRCHQMAAYSPDHALVLLPGGWRNDEDDPGLRADTWVFDVAAERWEERRPGGEALAPFSDAALVYHPLARRFVLFSSAVFLYDPAANTWERRGEPEVVRADGTRADYTVGGSAMAAYEPESGRILLFGGQSRASGFSDATATYDLAAHRFTLLAPPEAPAARVRAGFAYDAARKRFVLFGGVRGHDSERFDDLWSFDPASGRWTRHDSSNGPGARGGYLGMARDEGLDRFYLACGRHAKERFLDETWSLHLDERARGRARYVFDRSVLAEERWFLRAETPGDARIELAFAASADGLEWGPWGPHAPADGRYLQVELTLVPGSGGEVPAVHSLGFE